MEENKIKVKNEKRIKCEICQSFPLDLNDEGSGSCFNCDAQYLDWNLVKNDVEKGKPEYYISPWAALLIIGGLGVIFYHLYSVFLMWTATLDDYLQTDLRLCGTLYAICMILFVSGVIMEVKRYYDEK